MKVDTVWSATAGKLRDAAEELEAAFRLVFTCLIKREEGPRKL